MKQKFGSFDKGSETTVLTDISVAMETPRVCPARRRSSLALARERTNGSRRSSAVSSRRGSSVSRVSEGGAKPGKEAVTLNYYVEDKSTLDTLHLKAADVSSHQESSLHISTYSFRWKFGYMYLSLKFPLRNPSPRVSLVHWAWDMATILQATFSNAFIFSIEFIACWPNFFRRLFLRVLLTLIQHWFR